MNDDHTKRIAVFGASGGVGRHVVTDALAAGYEVRAFVRDASKLTVTDPQLTVIAGQLDDADRVGEAVTGVDAVISALGPDLSRGATGMALVDGTRTIVTAMQNAGVDRYIGMATPSLRDERDTRSILGTIVPIMGRLIYPRAYRELLAMSQIVTSSNLGWTIARFVSPTDAQPQRSVKAGFLGRDKIGASIARADIAHFLLSQVDDQRFIRAAPAISG
jgi:putative NADH-flavin reductase